MNASTANNTILLLLHELTHMNARARARHRVAAASLRGAHRHEHERAADRHGIFAQALATRVRSLGGGSEALASVRTGSDVHNGQDAQLLLPVALSRLLARYEEGLMDALDSATRRLLLDQYRALRDDGGFHAGRRMSAACA